MKKELSLNIREMIVKNYHDGKSIMEISNIFNCHRKTVTKIIKDYNAYGVISTKKRGGNGAGKKLTEENCNLIQAWIDEDCSMSLKAITNKLIIDCDISVSLATVDRTIKEFSYSLKRVSLIPERRNTNENIECRYQYASNFLSLLPEKDGENIVFLDEVGFNISMRAKRGRSKVGTPAIHVVPGIRNRNFSVCCAMNKNGPIHNVVQDRPFNKDFFTEFLKNMFHELQNKTMNNCIIVMDNVPFHKSTDVRNIIQEKGHRCLFLPPYSPFLNPIENMFSQWKEGVRRSNVNNEQELINAINVKYSEISSTHCRNYYNNMLRYIGKCKDKMIIVD